MSLSQSVETIGGDAFAYSPIAEIEIPKSVVEIGDNPFRGYGNTIITVEAGSSFRVEEGCLISKDNVLISGANNSHVSIPSSVTAIGGYAFYGYIDVETIEIPNSVISIGPSAFMACSSLSTINLPNEITSIDVHTFGSCTSLKTIKIPDSVKIIDHYAFWGCTALSSIEIPNSCEEIGVAAFCKTALSSIHLPSKITKIGAVPFGYCLNLKEITLGEGCEFRIENDCLVSKDGVLVSTVNKSKIVIPSIVTTIGDEAFCGFTSIASVVIPTSVSEIEKFAFLDCSGLKSITLMQPDPSKIKLGKNIFYKQIYDGTDKNSCILYVPKGSEGAYKAADEWKEFVHIRSYEDPDEPAEENQFKFHVADDGSATITGVAGMVENLVIPEKIYNDGKWHPVVAIEDNAFYKNSSIKSCTVPVCVRYIGNCAFYDCFNLRRVNIGYMPLTSKVNAVSANTQSTTDGLQEIGDCAFKGTGLEDIYIPASVKHIGKDALDCVLLKEINVDENNEYYSSVNGVLYNKDKSALVLCPEDYGATDFVIPEGVNTIAESAFYKNKALEHVTIPASVVSIGDAAFRNCGNLLNVNIPDGVTNIGDWIFSYCSKLKSVHIPASVTSIGGYAFWGCFVLDNIVEEQPDPTMIKLGKDVFTATNYSSCTLYVPAESIEAYKAAEQWRCFAHVKAINDPSGIMQVTEHNGKNKCYNLNGQRVDAPTKSGLYIINGKKVMVK